MSITHAFRRRAGRTALCTVFVFAIALGALSSVGAGAASAAVPVDCTGARAFETFYAPSQMYAVGGARCNPYFKLRVQLKRDGVLIDDHTQRGYFQPWQVGSVGGELTTCMRGRLYQTVVIVYLWNGSSWVRSGYWTDGAPHVKC